MTPNNESVDDFAEKAMKDENGPSLVDLEKQEQSETFQNQAEAGLNAE